MSLMTDLATLLLLPVIGFIVSASILMTLRWFRLVES